MIASPSTEKKKNKLWKDWELRYAFLRILIRQATEQVHEEKNQQIWKHLPFGNKYNIHILS